MLFFKKNKNPLAQDQGAKIAEERKYLLTPRSNFYVREGYKTLRTNLTFSLTGEGPGAKVLAITSSLQSEGKSITSCNIAISFAMSEKKVLLIDCDMRRPKLSRLFNLSSPVGLSNLLMDPDLEATAVCPSGIVGLDLLHAGDVPPNPSELLASARMSKLIDRMKEKYDIIILDTPPVNMVTDPLVLAPLTDGVLFVVRAFQSERSPVSHALEQLEYVHAKVLGFVLNGNNMEGEGYRFRYGRYHLGYGYGYRGYGYSSSNNKNND